MHFLRRLSSKAATSILSPMTNLSSLRKKTPLRIVGGNGCHVMDDTGKEYIEAMAGLWCTSLGWGNKELVEASNAQMRQLAYYHGFTGRTVPVVEELAEKLVNLAPERFRGGRVFFGSSGSDANDTQVRIIWNYYHAMGRPKKRKLISRQKGYHGVTVAAGSLTGLPYVHEQMGLPLEFVAAHVSCPSFYRLGAPGESEAQFTARLADELDKAITAAGGSDEVAAFIAEPIQGAGGVVVPPEGYFTAMREVCDRHEMLMIGDEVICGFGRTGSFWGASAVMQKPDLLSCAKQLTSGYLPLSAAILPADVYDVLEQATKQSGGVFGHGYTYSGHPVACAVGLKVLEIMDRDQLVEGVRDCLGPHFQSRLRALAAHPLVGEARGAGLIGGVELVQQKESKRSFAPKHAVAAQVVNLALKRGLIVRPLPGDVIAVCPPLIITTDEIDEIFDILESALDEILLLCKGLE